MIWNRPRLHEVSNSDSGNHRDFQSNWRNKSMNRYTPNSGGHYSETYQMEGVTADSEGLMERNAWIRVISTLRLLRMVVSRGDLLVFTGNSSIRSQSWTLRCHLAGVLGLPWLCLGDFNEILWDSEKSGGADKSWRALADFIEALEDSNLENIGFGSDRRPVVVDFALATHSKNIDLINRDRRLFFEECWLDAKECRDIVEAVWRNCEPMCKKRNNQRRNLRQKRNALKEVCKGNEGLDWRKVREVVAQLDEVLEIEERYWKQRAKIVWLNSGDRNT
ncbi:hypothetical protein Ddye_019789 [Dipteronia dyeriana]|uniref:Endonuclease/exonuclease/phosphatase domain-containing protein n=1 Tax=Dipteronia dyeriana TaxID=168575 RepID=A0AAD9WUS1_9ROSI|nr:hypothetical protein Ddye_019789 [Dipteronia dyeriana]